MIDKSITYDWHDIGDIYLGRPNLGDMVPVKMYRMLLYSIRDILTKEFDKDFADTILYKSGMLVGEKFCKDNLDTSLELNDFFTELRGVLIEHKIGILRIEKVDMENLEFELSIAEDLDCSGLPFLDDAVCNFDEGFIAGIMKAYTGKDMKVKEIDCWATGGRVCRFLVNDIKKVD